MSNCRVAFAFALASGAALLAASAVSSSTGAKDGRPYWVANPALASVEGRGPEVTRGKQVYDKWCTACHGPGPGRFGRGLTGTESLEAKYEGALPPILDERTDLTPEIVDFFVRNGNTSMMPFFRKTEISDQELHELGAYLSRLNPDAQAPGTVTPGK